MELCGANHPDCGANPDTWVQTCGRNMRSVIAVACTYTVYAHLYVHVYAHVYTASPVRHVDPHSHRHQRCRPLLLPKSVYSDRSQMHHRPRNNMHHSFRREPRTPPLIHSHLTPTQALHRQFTATQPHACTHPLIHNHLNPQAGTPPTIHSHLTPPRMHSVVNPQSLTPGHAPHC